MNTISVMRGPMRGPVRGIAAAVTGSRHARAGRNGQDAAALWTDRARGAIVVCDGCGSGTSSEVGARLGARLVIAGLATRLQAGARAGDPALWSELRREVVAELQRLVRALGGEPAQVVHDHFLFTIIAAAVSDGELAVWAVGDGAYAIDQPIGRGTTVLGPFESNQPPYVAYDLLPSVGCGAFEGVLEVASTRSGSVVVATDGVAELGLDAVDFDRAFGHPDGLRRQLAVLARGTERIDWERRRVDRMPARLQDDGAVAALRWSL